MKRLVGLVGATGAGAALYVSRSEDYEGFRRSARLWSTIGPVIAHYRLVEFKHKVTDQLPEGFGRLSKVEKNENWSALHIMYADHVLESLKDLKGFYIKVGQVIANRPDLAPRLYIEKLRTLEDAVPYRPIEEAKEIIRESLRLNSVYDVFDSIDPIPVGSASIGQVHRARLHNGKDVAVKIQYPGVELLFRDDIKTARNFSRVMAPEHLIIFDEIEKQFLTEFDYRREAEHLEISRTNLIKFSKEIVIPKPYLEYCSKEVLVMDFLEGPKLVDGIRKMARVVAAKEGKTLDEYEEEMMEKFQTEGLPPPYSGPGPFVLDLYRIFLKYSAAFKNVFASVYNVFLAWPLGLQQMKPYEVWLTINPSRVMDTLMNVHGEAMLVYGYFNGDPHAGNYLVLEDDRIGVIDFGQVKKLTHEERLNLCRVYKAVYRNDRDKMMQLAKELHYRSKNFDKDVLFKMVTFSLDRDGRDVCDGLNVQQFLDKMFATDPWENMADLLIMPVRSAFLLRGIGLMLNHPVSCAHYWGPIAERVLEMEGAEY